MDTLKTLTTGAACECGNRLPWHLIGLFDGAPPSFSHVCQCGLTWEAQDAGTVTARPSTNDESRFAKAVAAPH